MSISLAALLCFGILTLWAPGYPVVAVFQVGMFALATIAVWRARNSPPRFAYPLLPLTFAVAWGLFQLFGRTTLYGFATQRATVQWATFLAVFVTAICVLRTKSARLWLTSVMLWFGLAVAVIATIQTFTSGGKVFWLFPTEYKDSVMGPILYRNHYAAFIEIVLPLALYRSLRSYQNQLLYAAVAGVMYASVIASASRAGTLLCTAEIIVVIALMWIRHGSTGRKVVTSFLKTGIPFAAFAAVVGLGAVWSRFVEGDGGNFRHLVNAASLHMIREHLLVGVGLGNWPVLYPRYAVVDFGVFVNQAHNDWLQWTAEGGLPFGIILATLFLWCLRPAFRTVWGLGIVAVFLHALVDYPFSRPALGSWAIVMAGLLAADGMERKPSATPLMDQEVDRPAVRARQSGG